jgi:hypothetical protein
MPPSPRAHLRNAELAEALDRIMNKGAVLQGDVVLTVADVDLLYLDLRVVLGTVDTVLGPAASSPAKGSSPAASSPAEGSSPHA